MAVLIVAPVGLGRVRVVVSLKNYFVRRLVLVLDVVSELQSAIGRRIGLGAMGATLMLRELARICVCNQRWLDLEECHENLVL